MLKIQKKKTQSLMFVRWNLFFGFIWLLTFISGCTSPSINESPSDPYYTYRPAHKKQEVKLTFHAWVSEAEKLAALEATAKIEASQKCKGHTFTLTDLLSDKHIFGERGVNIISANIKCNIPIVITTPYAEPARQPILSEPLETPAQISQEKNDRLSLEVSKKKCTELGFKPTTEGYGKCVLQLSK